MKASLLLLALAAAVLPCAAQPGPAPDTAYTVVIERQASTRLERTLIARAEAALPPRDSVLRAAARRSFGTHPGLPEGPLWWYGEFDGTRLPYALTGGAVAYYAHLMQRIRRRETRVQFSEASLRYHARVEHLAPAAGPSAARYVVRMRLAWEQTCGDLCGLSLQLDRAVFFDARGRLLRVEGDGTSSTAVS